MTRSPAREPADRLLTIAIPTFNRAELLDAQLAWLARAIHGHEHDCEIFISDNCSTDDTPLVIERWRASFVASGLDARVHRQAGNLGAIRNVAFCMQQARGAFVWTISDDDAIGPGTLAYVLDQLEAHPDLQNLVLNFSARHHATGALSFARCFEIEEDWVADPGDEIVEWALRHPQASRWGGLVLTTAQVYRTATAQAALRAWPEGFDNLYLQFFVTAYCAKAGQTMLTRDTHLEMAGGRHFFTGQRRLLFFFKLVGMPESLVQVAGLGYPPDLCLEKVAIERRRLGLRSIVRHAMERPPSTLRMLRRHVRAVRAIRRLGHGRDDAVLATPESGPAPA